MRVATLNLLHGVPLRDRIAEARGSGASGRGGAGAASEQLPEQGAPEAHGTATEVAEAGVAPTERHVWSPDVPDPSDLVRAIEELQEAGPIDVLALQEVDRYQERTAGVDQARIAAEVLGAAHWRFVPSVRGTPGIAAEGAAWVPATEADDVPDGESEGEVPRDPARREPRYGIALISRLPVREWRVRRFPPVPVSLPLLAPSPSGRPRAVRVPDEPRSAVSVIVETPEADVTVATAHLTFVPGANTKQLHELRAFLAGRPRPMILMGDFNTPGGIPGLVTGWDQVARRPTYPVARPRVQFDHILANGWTGEAVEHARRSVQVLPLSVSDHCALVAEFPAP
ncbi:MAG: endonuclease/exonuclease/phosphatase family protein [Candidatus Nanopelagicales bacterium]|nr:endonuclease/exonuclease/phosphatase family protein [Candidatus Nanopelagicales bacterium]